MFAVGINGTDLRLWFKEGWGFVVVTKERDEGSTLLEKIAGKTSASRTRGDPAAGIPEEAIGLFKCINKAIDHNHQKHCLLVNA